jgi:uncharacterized iron-regulated protein
MTWAHAQEEAANQVLDLASLMNMERLIEQVADKRVVYVGESHTQYQHHLNQLALIEGMHERQPRLAIGLEFFFQPFQAALDRYIAGEIEEEALLRETEYFDRWHFDYRLYRPIFRYAREHGIPLIALNLEREITKQVAKGGIESLTEEQKARLPQEIDRENEAYRARVQEVFNHHPQHNQSSFENFLEVQLLWDESMAERAATWLQANADGHMVILAGVGHLMYKNGIPERLQRRVLISSAVILNVNVLSELEPGVADYLVMAAGEKLPPSGKLGVFLELEGSPPLIKGFDETSGAAKAGLHAGDKLLSIDGDAISSYTDVRIALLDKAVGETVELEVEREQLLFGTQRKKFTVTLN